MIPLLLNDAAAAPKSGRIPTDTATISEQDVSFTDALGELDLPVSEDAAETELMPLLTDGDVEENDSSIIATPEANEDEDVVEFAVAEAPVAPKTRAEEKAAASEQITAPRAWAEPETAAKARRTDAAPEPEKPLPQAAGPKVQSEKPTTSLAQTVLEGRLPTATPRPEGGAQQLPPSVEVGQEPVKTDRPIELPRNAAAVMAAVALAQEQSINAAVKKVVQSEFAMPETDDLPKEEKLPLRDVPPVEIRRQPLTSAPASAPPPAVALAQVIGAQPKATDVSPLSLSLGEGDALAAAAPAERGSQPTLQTPTAAPTTAGAETARQAAQQIAVAISSQPGRPTDIALHPEELGRVRLSMTTVDATITMTVQAERPETSDLLRRHIDALEQEFRSLGYDDISFSFGDDGGTSAQPDEVAQEAGEVLLAEADLDELTHHDAPQPVSGLDLRL